MKATTIQIRQRGTVTLPAKLREKYRLEEGDALTVIDMDGVMVVAPKLSLVPKLASEIERLRKRARLTVEDLTAGLEKQRERYVKERDAKRR